VATLNKSLAGSNTVYEISSCFAQGSAGGSQQLVNAGPTLAPGDTFTIFTAGGAPLAVTSHVRASQTGGMDMGGRPAPLQDIAKRYVGTDGNDRLADADLRIRLAGHLMDAKAHSLTLARIAAEARGNPSVSAAASILKNSATHVAQTRAELTLEIMGHQGLGWEGDAFSSEELAAVRGWLSGKAMSIYGGSFEIQNNLISKNILGLPETTQKG
jgi:alkylation response protein AidB-like acyl-CoA dehydrogenase